MEPESAPPVTEEPKRNKRRIPYIIWGILLVVVAGGLAYYFISQEQVINQAIAPPPEVDSLITDSTTIIDTDTLAITPPLDTIRIKADSLYEVSQYRQALQTYQQLDSLVQLTDTGVANNILRCYAYLQQQAKDSLTQLASQEPEKPAAKTGTLKLKTTGGNPYTYQGEIVDGMANGKGVATFDKGGYYEGQFKNNQFHGKGTITLWNQQRYTGTFREGKIAGYGTYTWPTGDKYVGQFRNGRRNGKGILYDRKNRIKHDGQWENDQFIESKSSN